jgi:hypothetical protein
MGKWTLLKMTICQIRKIFGCGNEGVIRFAISQNKRKDNKRGKKRFFDRETLRDYFG